jgi:hypothetical protein
MLYLYCECEVVSHIFIIDNISAAKPPPQGGGFVFMLVNEWYIDEIQGKVYNYLMSILEGVRNVFRKNETPSPAPVSKVRPVSPGNGNGRKTREEHRMECDRLIREAVKTAASYLAEQVIKQKANEIIEGGSNVLHMQHTGEVITEKEINDLKTEEGIEGIILGEMRSDQELPKILIEIIERGEKSPKELGRKILERNGLGDRILKDLEKKRIEERKKLVAEEERLAQKKETK